MIRVVQSLVENADEIIKVAKTKENSINCCDNLGSK